MALNLNKLPWYAQVGLFLVLAAAGVGAFYYLYAIPAQEEMAHGLVKGAPRSE